MAYLSPEQVLGNEVDDAADVYSLGLVLLEALTGERAYPGPAVDAAFARVARGPAVPGTLPPAWRRLLAAMTASDPAARPAAAEVARELAVMPGSDAATATRQSGTASYVVAPLVLGVGRAPRATRRRPAPANYLVGAAGARFSGLGQVRARGADRPDLLRGEAQVEPHLPVVRTSPGVSVPPTRTPAPAVRQTVAESDHTGSPTELGSGRDHRGKHHEHRPQGHEKQHKPHQPHKHKERGKH